jgi:hypothetical protein
LRRDKEASPNKSAWTGGPLTVQSVGFECLWTLGTVNSSPHAISRQSYHAFELFCNAIPPNPLTVDCIYQDSCQSLSAYHCLLTYGQ